MLRDLSSWRALFERWRFTRVVWLFIRPIIALAAYGGLFLGVAAIGFSPLWILQSLGVMPPGLLFWLLAFIWFGIVAACCCLLGFRIYQRLRRGCLDLEMWVCMGGLVFAEWVMAEVLHRGWHKW